MTVTILCKYSAGGYHARCPELKVSASSTGEPPARCAVLRCAVKARAKSLGLPLNPDYESAWRDEIKISCVAKGIYIAEWPDPRDAEVSQ